MNLGILLKNKQIQYILFVLIAALIGLFLYEQGKNNSVQILSADSAQQEQALVVVHVEGAVVYPGIYKVSSNVRIYEVLLLAGGIKPYADLKKINLARTLQDGEKIKILGVPAKRASNAVVDFVDISQKININIASKKELAKLPGVGPSYAARIVSYRKEKGKFTSITDLLNIKGIGLKKIAKIQPYIVF